MNSFFIIFDFTKKNYATGPNIRQPSPSPALPPHASPGPSNQPTPSPGFMVPSPVNNPASLGSPFPSAASPLAAGSPSMPRPSPRSLQVYLKTKQKKPKNDILISSQSGWKIWFRIYLVIK